MTEILRLGIAGVGIAAQQVLPHIHQIADKVRLSAAADTRPETLKQFAAEYPDVQVFASVEELCRSPDVDVVWVSTPNEFHSVHAVMAAENGKHVVCEKPMAITLEECSDIVRAVEANRVKYVQGHSKIYYAPIRKMREIIRSGSLGRVTQINTWNFNDWLIRPMTASEVRTAGGTGPVFRQGPHQVDIVRYLAGARAKSVRAVTGRWDPAYPETESDHTALLMFDDGPPATLVFNAQGYFDAAELTWGIGEGGYRMFNAESQFPRERRSQTMSPAEKNQFQARGDPYGRGPQGGEDNKVIRRQPFFGITMVSCERGVIRQSPDGVYVYDKDGRQEISCAVSYKRGAAELLELVDAIAEDRQPFLDAQWGMATAEVCIAILASSERDREVVLSHQHEPRKMLHW